MCVYDKSMNNTKPFTCYFCNQTIKNESEVGHTALCSKVLIPCSYKCGSYIQRENMAKHKSECVNNTNSLKRSEKTRQPVNTIDRNGVVPTINSKVHEDITRLQQRYAELENRLQSQQSYSEPDNSKYNLADMKNNLNHLSIAVQKLNYAQGILSEWRKNIDSQASLLKTTIASVNANNQSQTQDKELKVVQEKLLEIEHLKMNLNMLNETVYKENSNIKKTEMNFARSLDDLNTAVVSNRTACVDMWNNNSKVLDNVIGDLRNTLASLDEQKAKTASLVFDIRAVNQMASEAADKTEIHDKEVKQLRRELNQLQIDSEVLESIVTTSEGNSGCYKQLLWRITEIESKMIRAKENAIVLKSPIFYTHQYGYKIRLLLYLNGLNKWKDRYALACLHVLKGEFDPLLKWPCTLEGTIALRDLSNIEKPKNFSKYIKTKRSEGDEDEDEPQESNPTYIFIPHNVLLKDTYVKDDTIFLDINIEEKVKYETAI
ncbi:TNF-receptor-associated factor-like isoform X1 [Rhynchophorus ferrugineus]|uniref:TNF-receptor-associated factor-like isoform X1 n=1 Tax=Rhynchophorus ferrugineus TaxID=354439 RepID=UPI003FCDC8D1